MREDYGSLPMNMHDDGFGEIGFDTPDLARDGGLNPTIDVSRKIHDEKRNKKPKISSSTISSRKICTIGNCLDESPPSSFSIPLFFQSLVDKTGSVTTPS